MATGEILKVIAGSPSDVQPVFETICKSAAQLCNAKDAVLWYVDGDTMRVGGHFGDLRVEEVPVASSAPGRAVLDREVVHVRDLQAETVRFPRGSEVARRLGLRTTVNVPLLHEGKAIGVISARRAEIQPFSDKQIALLKTFADQAVIAIENVRLFNETREALERQTATSEILRVISQSPTDTQPVFKTIVASAARLCDADFSAVARFEGGLLHLVAVNNMSAAETAAYHAVFPRAPGRHFAMGRAFVDGRPVHIENIETDPDYDPWTREVLSRAAAYRTFLGVPILQNGLPIGAIGCGRHEMKPFTAPQIELVKTFADQAVIAMENVRLFNETKEALEQQKASAEVLAVISNSIADTKPVFDKILESCTQLFGGHDSGIALVGDDGLVHLAAHHGSRAEGLARAFPVPLSRESGTGTAIIERCVVHYPDTSGPDVPPYVRRVSEIIDFKSVIFAPMFWEERGIGAIYVGRRFAAAFTEKQIALLKTFADQAVIAIENGRLFAQLQERTAALTKSVGQLTALGEVGQAISSTLDLETVLKTIVSRAVQLARLDAGAIYEYDEPSEQFHLRAAENISEEALAVYRSAPIRKGDGAVGGTAVGREPIQIPETQDESYKSQFRDLIIRTGRRALLAVPLIHEEQIVGALAVQRNTPGPFAPEVVDLLKTFATQSALAIQNAKLFREIQEKSAQLEVANKHKSDFLANMSHELRTPLNAIIGFSEALMDQMFGDLNEKQLEYQKDIHESGKHLLSLINDILDLSKIEAGRMELELSRFHLPTAVSNAVTLIRERAMRHGIALGVDIDKRLGDLQADERKVKQILLNLLSNAVKFTPDGGRVDVSAKLDTDKIEIAVRDTGVGIAPEDQAVLFEEFKQLGKDSSRKAEGTGLGLALTKRLVELHGGQIRVDSAVGHGSTFRVILPSPT
ncbi:MAG TPA: GAF domain-containing protein [Burkholderiales bacterium]|nr:GAF domain-containing protein [Burkholderiales bacterium]